MQKAMCVNTKPLEDEALDEELIDTLIAISVVSQRIATKLRKVKNPAASNWVFDPRGSRQISMQAWLLGSLLAGIKDEGDKKNEPHE